MHSPLHIRCKVFIPKTIYTQPTEMDSAGFIHILAILKRKKLEGMNLERDGEKTRKGESDVIYFI